MVKYKCLDYIIKNKDLKHLKNMHDNNILKNNNVNDIIYLSIFHNKFKIFKYILNYIKDISEINYTFFIILNII